jgi:hypothetical protein
MALLDEVKDELFRMDAELPPDEGAKLGGERVGVEAIVSL